MAHFRLYCTACDARQADVADSPGCPRCGGPLLVEMLAPGGPSPFRELPGLWRYWASLPLHAAQLAVSLGEGSTPCVHLERVGNMMGLHRLYAKLEYLNPTGSFKDRGTAVVVSSLRERGIKAVAEDSSGNAGASLAAYCARAGVNATVFAPASAPPSKVQQIRFYGAQVEMVEGNRQAAADTCREFCARNGVFYASHNWHPFFIEGMKGVAFELADQFSGALPQHIVFPVGNGSLLLGVWKGFKELREQKAGERKQATRGGKGAAIPLLHCVQSRRCMPIVAAFHGERWEPPARVRTVAGGIAVTRPPRQAQVLAALRETGGRALAVEEGRIVEWQRLLARHEGVFCEPTSAAAFAGLELLVQQKAVAAQDVIVVMVTGFGLKDRLPR